MKIYLYNTLTGKKELLLNPKGKSLRFFVCGPTVYDYPHIGNSRTYVVFDAFVKYLRTIGYSVFYLQNITDIDDKIINRANTERTSWIKISKTFLDIYRRNMKDLGVDAVDSYAKATDHIPQILSQVRTLIENQHAYEIPNEGIYFDITTFPNYGKLSRRTALQAEDAVSRIDDGVNKRNKGDFALWKFSKANEPSWQSPWGLGRPGWHIEDTAITDKYFGPQYDLHGGATDLKFPHHEAEIAQQESISGKEPFVKIWMHTGFLTLNGQKMSKSAGNYMTVDQFLKSFSAQVFRLMVLSNHYRSPLDYSQRLGQENKARWLLITEFLAKLDLISKKSAIRRSVSLEKYLKSFDAEFTLSLADDFNTPKAFGILFKFISDANPKIWDLSKTAAYKTANEIKKNLKSLGFKVIFPEIPKKIQKLSSEREKFRRNQQFMQSDSLRKKINDLGFGVEDTPLGSFVWPLGAH